MHFYKPVLITLLFILSAGKLLATHYYGMDLFYTHVSGNTYRVSLVAFGDCSGQAFPSFSTSRPRIYIRLGNTDVLSGFLEQEPPKAGIEVTNGCPADLKRSTCVDPNGTIPGVKKFVYSREFTLPHQAPNWTFVSLGETDGPTIAGRSNSLTNISPVGVIRLEATLNNTQQNNSSPQFSTIATQFYCLNTPVVYAHGASDADGDNLVYELVSGLDVLAPVTYNPGYSGSKPLAVAPGTFSFSSSTGLLSFTPNIVQKSLVVYKISEYRNGALVGTVMREMTMMVTPCINYPPVGYITNAAGADIVTVKTCIGSHEVAFDLNPTDANGHIITMAASGLPTGAKLDITNNNTKNPKSRFVWNMPDLPEGDYTFYVAYADDGCPAALDTQAYTIRLKHEDIFAEIIAADCERKGLIKITTQPGWTPWAYTIYEDLTPVYSMKNIINSTAADSMLPGKYKVQAINYIGCTAEALVEIPYNCDIADLPTAFSPNGDGKNDMLLVRGGNVQDMHLRIYNRWGQLIFETRDIKTGWDGRFNGHDAPVESYAFVLSVAFRSGQAFQKKGNITLLR